MLLLIAFFLMVPMSINSKEDTNQLNTNQEMVDFIDKQPGNISFYYENINTGYNMYYYPDKVFYAASTVKLPMALYVSKLAADNKVDLNEIKTYEGGHYSGGAGIIQFDPIGSQYSLDDILEKSIVHSDNIAYIMLLERFNRKNLIDFMHMLGGEYAYQSMENLTTARDMGQYLKDLYEFSNSEELGQKLIDYLKSTVFNDAIPTGVSDTEVAHKIGYLTNRQLYHDVGIVYDEQPYILAVLTEGNIIDSEWQTIANLTEIIHKEHKRSVFRTRKENLNLVIHEGKGIYKNQWNNLYRMITNLKNIFIYIFGNGHLGS